MTTQQHKLGAALQEYGDPFSLDKQGCSLAPPLFNLYTNDLNYFLLQEDCHSPYLT